MNMAYHDAKYADLYEETLYNAILGSIDLRGKEFLLSQIPWIPAVALPLACLPVLRRQHSPRPAHASDLDVFQKRRSIYVNLFIGGSATIENVAGTNVELVQTTDYPWDGRVSITVNPAAEKNFAVNIRVPNRNVSKLYTSSPEADGIVSLSVNGKYIQPTMDKGYAVINRAWKAGDKIDFILPLKVQRVKASGNITADKGRVALRTAPWSTILKAPTKTSASFSVRSPNFPRSGNPIFWAA